MNSQSAVAHKYLFEKIRQIVFQDTGERIKYRHLHSENLSKHQGIRHWGIDQDRGQAKGSRYIPLLLDTYSHNRFRNAFTGHSPQ